MSFKFSSDISKEKIRMNYNILIKEDLIRSYNIGPSDNAYVLINDDKIELKKFKWGLIPYWANDAKSVNHLTLAMAEGIESKDSFRIPIRKRRCIIFADSYYDSNRINKNDCYFRFILENHSLMAFAGIWNMWNDDVGNEHYSFSIITSAASERLKRDGWNRMPVIFTEENEIIEWLNKEKPLYQVLKMLKPIEGNRLEYYRISDEIKYSINNYPELHKEFIEEE